MTAYQLEFGTGASTNEARMHPCQASGTGPHAQVCGATPASVWERYCVNGHSRDVRLCPSHAFVIASGQGACCECADKGTSSQALLRPKDLILLGHLGS
jgi:hypothetical protein